MNIELLYEFNCLAKFLNFSKTSQYLNMTQPTLSRHISQLEAELDVQLFYRDSVSVKLTDAGVNILPVSERIIADYDKLQTQVKEYKLGVNSSISVGYRKLFRNALLPNILLGFQKNYPQVKTNYFSVPDFVVLYERLLNDEIDVAICPLLDEFNTPDFDIYPLCKASFSAVLNRNHPLADRQQILFSDLADYPVIFPDEKHHLTFRKKLLELFSEHQVAPQIAHSVRLLDDADLLLESNQGINIILDCYNDTSNPSVCSIEMPETKDIFDIVLVKKASNKNPATGFFIKQSKIERT